MVPAAVVGGLAGVLAGGAIAVWADGGDSSLVHACVDPGVGFDQPNVRIVGANESCAGGFETVHWPASAENVINQLTPPPSAGDNDAKKVFTGIRPSKVVTKKLYKPLGVKTALTKEVSSTVGPDNVTLKETAVACPGSHPFLLSGGYDADPNLTFLYFNGPVGLNAWRTKGFRLPFPSGNWSLTVTAICAKVAKSR